MNFRICKQQTTNNKQHSIRWIIVTTSTSPHLPNPVSAGYIQITQFNSRNKFCESLVSWCIRGKKIELQHQKF